MKPTQPARAEPIPFSVRRTRGSDLDAVVRLERAPDNAPFVSAWPRSRHAAALEDPGVEHSILAIDGSLVGYFILRGVGSSNVEILRLVVGRKGLGIGSSAVREIERHAFETLGAHRLWLDVLRDNARARHVYEKVGFTRDGVLRGAHDRDGERVDLVLMSKLRREWRGGSRGRTAGR